MSWRPIATAPRDGAWILAYWPTMALTLYPAVVFWDDGWVMRADFDYGEVFPTAWMPCPPAPVAAKFADAGDGALK